MSGDQSRAPGGIATVFVEDGRLVAEVSGSVVVRSMQNVPRDFGVVLQMILSPGAFTDEQIREVDRADALTAVAVGLSDRGLAGVQIPADLLERLVISSVRQYVGRMEREAGVDE